MRDSLLTAGNVMRIVAGEAGHLTVAKTCGHTQPVSRMRDLEGVIPSLACLLLVTCGLEVELEISQRLARAIRKGGSIEGTLFVRVEPAGLKMALQTYFELPFAAKPATIHDGWQHQARRGVDGSGRLHVGASRHEQASRTEQGRKDDGFKRRGKCG
jgi:hypothetical protein